jgi:putative salt-induced outer membrane protein YdiY
MNLYRFEGQLAGVGISYGYHWILGPRWSLEAEIGAGYARLWYDKYPCRQCAKLLTNEKLNYWGLTRAGINLIYLF